jgi:hypothetical protein
VDYKAAFYIVLGLYIASLFIIGLAVALCYLLKRPKKKTSSLEKLERCIKAKERPHCLQIEAMVREPFSSELLKNIIPACTGHLVFFSPLK